MNTPIKIFIRINLLLIIWGNIQDSNAQEIFESNVDFQKMLQTRQRHRTKLIQKDLLLNEQQVYIDNRFNKVIIQKYTSPQPDSILSKFMAAYRPSYKILVQYSELELILYIRNSYKDFLQKRQSTIPNK